MEQDIIQLLIAGACGFLAALIFAKSWFRAGLIGALGAVPFTIFSVYMFSGGVDGSGFDASKLPEGSTSMMNFALTIYLIFGAAGAVGGLVSCALKKMISRGS